MRLRTQKLCFALASGVCLAGAAGLVAWGVEPIGPIATTARPKNLNQQTGSEQPAGNEREPALEEFAKLWDRPLRRALYDPPPPTPVVRELPPLGVEVLGTIVEPDNSMAIVRSEQGNVEYKRVGDTLGPGDSPASVIEIGAEAVVVERAAERITLGVRTNSQR